jgi:hypothetical protein
MNDLVTVEKSQIGTLLTVIEKMASSPEVDADKMMKIIDAQERIFDKNAAIAFQKAMASCQAEMPTIVRDAENTQTSSKYARYESILLQAKPCYTKHGFSLSFYQGEATEGFIRVCCDLMHMEGHKETFKVDLPVDMVGIKGVANKTQVHGTGSTFSYAKRYLFCMIFNVQIADQDDDGNAAGGITVSDLLEYIAFVREHFEEIAQIKDGLANDDYEKAAMAWCDMSEQEKQTLWKAPSKGGILTTQERAEMKDNKFSEACKSIKPGDK